MRAALISVALIVTGLSIAKEVVPPKMPVNAETGRFQYQEVVTVEGATADELYSRAKGFIPDAYKSAKAVLDFDDPGSRRLVARGSFEIPYMTAAVLVEHKLSIEAKDGRYRYILDQFVGVWPKGSKPLEDKWLRDSKLAARTAEQCEALVDALKSAMSRPPKEW
jgi:hypothetical protein